MEKIITSENLPKFAYVNDKVCKAPIKGIVLSFMGLGCQIMAGTPEGAFLDEDGKRYGEKGILYVDPYYNPWSWMNRQAVGFTDEILDVLLQKCSLPDNIPIAFSGGSMGGLSAIAYTVYAKRKPVSCTVNCPVCDLVYNYSQMSDGSCSYRARTIYSAFYDYEGTLTDAMKSVSPIYLADRLPRIPYHVFHCERDYSGPTERFVKEMRARNHEITYDIAVDRPHCDLTPKLWELYHHYCMESILA